MAGLAWVLRLNVVGGIILLLWVSLSGGTASMASNGGGFRGYVDELARAATSWRHLTIYAMGLGLYAIGVEVILRRIVQRPLACRWGATCGVLGSAGAYALVHVHHGVIGALYALTLGLWTGFVYSRTSRLSVLAVWHLQWDALTAVGALWLGMAAAGPVREAINFAYKSELIRTGRLQHHSVYGWLDAAHYWGAQRRICEVMSATDEGTEVTLASLWLHVDGTMQRVETRYRLKSGTMKKGRERLEVAASMVWDAAMKEEAAQAEATVMSGMRLSAWSFEDLPTTLLALHDAMETPGWLDGGKLRAGPMPEGFQIVGADAGPDEVNGHQRALLTQWAREGRGLVQLKRDQTWIPDLPALRNTMEVLKAKNGLAWECVPRLGDRSREH